MCVLVIRLREFTPSLCSMTNTIRDGKNCMLSQNLMPLNVSSVVVLIQAAIEVISPGVVDVAWLSWISEVRVRIPFKTEFLTLSFCHFGVNY